MKGVKNKQNKRGQAVASDWTVKMVLLIVGFVIILAFVGYYFLTTSDISREVCHSSVETRGMISSYTPDILKLQEIAPLKCQKIQLCLTDRYIGEKCNSLGKYDKRMIVGNYNEKEAELEKQISEQVLADWNMMGAGEDRLFPKTVGQKRYCVITTIIGFDESLKAEFKNQIYGTAQYMMTHKAGSTENSIWHGLTGGNPEQTAYFQNNLERSDSLSMGDKAIVFVQDTKGTLGGWIGLGTGTGGGAIAGGYIGTMIFPGIGTLTGAGIGVIAGSLGGGWLGYKAGNNIGDFFTEGNEVITKEGAISGIFIVDYDFESLRKLECDVFEGLA